MYTLGRLYYLSKIRFTRYHNKYFANKLSTKPKVTDEIVDDGPIKYSKSLASVYRAKTTRTGIAEPRLWYEPYVIMASLSVFLLYFTVIREENDIDQELNSSLYNRIAGLEEHQLRISLEYNRQHGLETEAIMKRLIEIEEEKNGAVFETVVK